MGILSGSSTDGLAAALERAGNRDATVQTLSGLNHMFQEAVTDSQATYAQIEQTFAPKALDPVSVWIARRFGAPAAQNPRP